tara:strand:+ start:820 stop:960 length:141 start_codon:yes stop_codon:yes gene_type:complete
LTKVEVEAKIYQLFNNLESDHSPQEYKGLAKDYLWKIMDYIKEFSN